MPMEVMSSTGWVHYTHGHSATLEKNDTSLFDSSWDIHAYCTLLLSSFLSFFPFSFFYTSLHRLYVCVCVFVFDWRFCLKTACLYMWTLSCFCLNCQSICATMTNTFYCNESWDFSGRQEKKRSSTCGIFDIPCYHNWVSSPSLLCGLCGSPWWLFILHFSQTVVITF